MLGRCWNQLGLFNHQSALVQLAQHASRLLALVLVGNEFSTMAFEDLDEIVKEGIGLSLVWPDTVGINNADTP